jgi:uncharacterized protein YfaS (alpha-2-macroglobulin family)
MHVPITREDEPGFFVSAQFVRDGKLHAGQKRIKVPPVDHSLNVAISTDKSQYLPGQTAKYELVAKTPDGKPLANADFSLGVVDEAIYAIQPDATPDIVKTFYGEEWDAVSPGNSLQYYFSGEAGKRRMRLAQLRPQSQLAQLKPEPLIRPKIRKAFPDTAFWAADVTTDANGHATVPVAFPDSLTTWRATVRGVTSDDRFGSGILKTIVRKNLIVRLAAPRFFVQGDEVVISGIVHNYLQSAKQAKVRVHLEGLDVVTGNTTQTLEIPVRGEVKVDWRVRARQTAMAKVTVEALTNEESDALENQLPIHPPGVPQVQARSGAISNDGEGRANFTFPADAVSGSRSLSIRVSPSIAGSVFSALGYLTSFPYGCVEQTMSSFLPNVMVVRASSELHIEAHVDEEDLNDKISAGLERLYNFQHEDGGWGWWETDETDPFMTAYVVAGFAEAKRAGVVINPRSLRRGVAWLSRQVGSEEYAPDLRVYMEFALAQAGQPATEAVNQSYHDVGKLSPYGTALLGLTFELQKDGRASSLAERLIGQAKQDGNEAWWEASRDEMLDFPADITPEATAYVVKFLSHERPASPLLPKAALWLVDHRNEGYWWSSTKQTAMVIYGLLDYLKTSNELHPDLTARILVNGHEVLTQKFDSDHLLGNVLELDESKLGATSNNVEIQSKGTGRLYYSINAGHNTNAATFEKNGAVSLNLLRDYFRLQPTRENGAIVYNLVPLQGDLHQGDVIAVRLTVTGSDWRYLLLEDPIPAGTEFVTKDSSYPIHERPSWWEYFFNRRELHDDRVAIFQKHFREGQTRHVYLLRVTNPGLFHVSPARVQPMYQPGHRATTEARTLEVK